MTPAQFARTPISRVRAMLRELDRYDQAQHRAASISTAKLAGIVIQVAMGLGGSKQPPKIQLRDFLPYPNLSYGDENQKLTEETRFVLEQLLAKHLIPMPIFAAIYKRS